MTNIFNTKRTPSIWKESFLSFTARYVRLHHQLIQSFYENVAIISAMLASIREDEVLVNGEAERIIKAGYEFVGEELKIKRLFFLLLFPAISS